MVERKGGWEREGVGRRVWLREREQEGRERERGGGCIHKDVVVHRQTGKNRYKDRESKESPSEPSSM